MWDLKQLIKNMAIFHTFKYHVISIHTQNESAGLQHTTVNQWKD